MALNIAAMQPPVNVVDQFIQGRAAKQAEQEGAMRMTALQNAEGRASAEENRQQSRYNWEQAANKVQMDQASAKQVLAGAQQVLAVPKGQRKEFVEKNFPEFVSQLSEQGHSWEDTDEDHVEEIAKGLAAHSSAALGQGQPAPLSDPGKIAADVRSGVLKPEQGDALLNAGDYTAPEAGIIDGKEVVYQANKKTGAPRVIPGVTPRPQKPLVSIGDKAESAGEVELARIDAKDYTELQNRGQAAQEKIGNLKAMLDSPAQTGPTQDFKAAANSFFSDLGVPISASKLEQVSNLAQYKSLQKTLVLQEKQMQKGVQTDNDEKTIEQGLGNTKNVKEANDLITKYQIALSDRDATLAKIAERHREETGKVDGYRKKVREYVRNTPLAAKNPKSGRLVFFNEFEEQAKAANPQASEEEILDHWRKSYGSR